MSIGVFLVQFHSDSTCFRAIVVWTGLGRCRWLLGGDSIKCRGDSDGGEGGGGAARIVITAAVDRYIN